MAYYDYKKGKERIDAILCDDVDVIDQNKLPQESEFTFDNAYHGWVTGLFVDIRKSTDLFTKEDKNDVSRLIRAFTSEIIEILRLDESGKPDNLLREIGVRGDCVYAVYTTPKYGDELEIADKAFWVNTFIKMLNASLSEFGYPQISVGIGISTAQEIVVKAGRKDVGINNLVWIGSAVTKSSKFSGLGNKNGNAPLVFSESSYNCFIDGLKERNAEADTWFERKVDEQFGPYYTANVVKTEFNNWVDGGMKK